ncbi:NDR1/HIN1-like protein 13 [Prosopis cineraria]|uniref:NDR1/HIN1-like protein 13 n=1 Tax=Prosopis cineraria TaxID=364024 RepID=UPI00240ECBF1|nr:NDR1/HIN1-like protein 13 [Prosopis cineraria]
MADRVHPRDSPPVSGESQPTSSQEHGVPRKPTPPAPAKPVPPPQTGTYVIQIPKDQVYRVPPPENAPRQSQYGRRKSRRSSCCCCLCWLIGLIFILIVLLGIAAGVMYLVFRPKAPDYTINSISVKGVNLTSVAAASSAISPEFDVAVRADNPNKKIGIYYEKDSSVEVYYKKVMLCNGALPAFYQPSNNVTVFQTVLKGSDIELTTTDATALVNAQSKRSVPITLKLRAPVKIKVGSVKTWKITVKVDCDVTVDNLTAQAKVVSKDCDYGVDLW